MTSVAETVTVDGDDGPVRLDRWFKRHYPALAHGRLEKLLRTGQIRVDGKRAKGGDRLMPGQAIRIPPLDEAPSPASATPRPLLPGRQPVARARPLAVDPDLSGAQQLLEPGVAERRIMALEPAVEAERRLAFGNRQCRKQIVHGGAAAARSRSFAQ